MIHFFQEYPKLTGILYLVVAAAINALAPPDETSSVRYRYLYNFLHALPIPSVRKN